MTTTEIREALAEVQHAVEVPPIDEPAFRARVRAERRRRNAGRALVAGTAAAAAAAVVVAGIGVTTHPGATPGHRVVPGPAADPSPAPTPKSLAVVRLDGRLQVLQPGDGGYTSDVRIQQVVGRTAEGDAVVIDDTAHLLRVPLTADGEPGDPVPLADGRPVVNAWLDKAGTTLAFVDRDDLLHLRPVGSGRDAETVPLLEQQTDLVATDGTSWVEDEGDRLSLRQPDQSFEVVPDADPFRAELAGGTLAVHTDAGVELFDAADGRRHLVEPGGAIGSLSPDGTTYAADPGARERFAGAESTLYVMDTRTGEQHRMAGYGSDLRAGGLAWQDDDRFLVLATSTVRSGNLVLMDCSVALGRCDERYDDPTGTLEISTQ